MTITAKVVADSISDQGIRITTMQLRYPKFIHGEFMTHRMFSRNASSSRAIPVERLIQDVIDDPAMPVFWGKNQKGMQAQEELAGVDLGFAQLRWLEARDKAVASARAMSSAGAHKQLVNRIIEPWCHINVVVTATEWANFYALRRHADAQPEMHALADAMWEAQQASYPYLLHPGWWHLPYVAESYNLDWTDPTATGNAIKASVARCARVSYLTHDGNTPDVQADLELYERLVGSVPMHASPTEHQATPHDCEWWMADHFWGNFRGWIQYRKTIIGESVR